MTRTTHSVKWFILFATISLWPASTWAITYQGQWNSGKSFTLETRKEGFTAYYSDHQYDKRRFTIQRHGAFVFGILRDGREEMGKSGPTIYLILIPADNAAYYVNVDDGWFGKLKTKVVAGTYEPTNDSGQELELSSAVLLRDTYCPVNIENKATEYEEFNGVFAGTMHEFCVSVFLGRNDQNRMAYSVGAYEPWNIDADKTKEETVQWNGISGVFKERIFVARRDEGLDLLYLAKSYATARLVPKSRYSQYGASQ